MKPFQKDAYICQEPFCKVSSLHTILLRRYIILVWVTTFSTLRKFGPPRVFAKSFFKI